MPKLRTLTFGVLGAGHGICEHKGSPLFLSQDLEGLPFHPDKLELGHCLLGLDEAG